MASERDYTPEELARFEAEVNRLRHEELPRVRDEEIKSAAQRTVAREIEIERDVYRDELNSEVEHTAIETPAEERREANRTVPSQILILVLLLLALGLIIAVVYPGGLRGFLGFGSATGASTKANGTNSAAGALPSLLGGSGANNGASGSITGGAATSGTAASLTGRGGDPNAGVVDPINSIRGPGGVTTDPLFWPFYSQKVGVRLCGLPLAAATTVNGRKVQWFERCRLEDWPEYSGTENATQLGLLGREYTDNRQFPQQTFFTSRPGLRFFAETGHGVGEPFLSFWEQNGDLRVFGFPISDVVQEEGEDGVIRNVQYFERVRMEEHVDQPDPNNQVMLGLLGRALFLHEAKPKIVEPLRPTPLPLP